MKKSLTLITMLLFLSIKAQNCNPSTALIDLDINNIRAKLLNGGDMWWDGSTQPGYEYPKIAPNTGAPIKNLLFGGGIWMTALDENDNLKCAAQTYRNFGHDFWPGPIPYSSGTVNNTSCSDFDRFFNLYRTELDAHINALNNATGPLNVSSISSQIKEWPSKGNSFLLSAYGIDIEDDLAPFEDCNGNGIYEPENGDYPLMKGDQSIFWVINDIGNTHTRSNGLPLGIEIQCMAYAYLTNDEVNNATFYDYKVIKKTSNNLEDFYFSQFVDPDLGFYGDDYIGSDISKDYGFAYNADNNDTDYGQGPPILVSKFLKTPSDLGMTSFVGFTNNTGPQSDPQSEIGFRNLQMGFWKDGSNITCGGNGYGGTSSTKYLFPNSPSTPLSGAPGCFGNDWSECTAGTIPDDRRFVINSGPYSLNVNDPLEFSIALIVVETDPTTYSGCPDKTTLINPVVNLIDNFIANVDDSPYACKVLNSITDFSDSDNLISIYPNPGDDFIMIQASDDFEVSTVQVYDLIGAEVKTIIQDNVIDVSSLSKGVYTLKIYSEKLNKTIIKKFVVK